MEIFRVCGKCCRSLPLDNSNYHKTGETYHTICKECRLSQAKTYNATEKVREQRAKTNRKRWNNLRLTTLSHYSGGSPKCQCCGETGLVFLTLDHVENNGNVHRSEIGIGGLHLYRWARDNDYPESLQVLCRNCNWAKHVLGECPHKRKESGSLRQAGSHSSVA